MKQYIVIASMFLAGCGDIQDRKQSTDNGKYRIIFHPHHGSCTIWTTPNAPYPVGAGWAFTLRDGRIVMLSGTVVIEEQK